METSESIELLIAALIDAQAEFPVVNKTKTATVPTKTGKYSYNYADLPDIIDATKPVLHKHGLVVIQTVGQIEWAAAEDNKVIPFISVHTMLAHISGQYVKDEGELIIPRNDPQSVGSAITYARRYGYTAIIGLAAEEDDDAASAMPDIIEHKAVAAMGRPPVAQRVNRSGIADPGSYVIDFGKHKGSTLRDIPLGYLNWLLENAKKQDVKNAIKAYYKQLEVETVDDGGTGGEDDSFPEEWTQFPE